MLDKVKDDSAKYSKGRDNSGPAHDSKNNEAFPNAEVVGEKLDQAVNFSAFAERVQIVLKAQGHRPTSNSRPCRWNIGLHLC